MNDALQTQLAELLKQLLALANDAGAFAQTQIPPLVQEKIIYGRVKHTALALLLLVLMWRLASLATNCYRQAADDRKTNGIDIWPERPGGLMSIVSWCATVVVGIFALVQLNQAVLAWVAPRLYVIEWLVGLTKTGL